MNKEQRPYTLHTYCIMYPFSWHKTSMAISIHISNIITTAQQLLHKSSWTIFVALLFALAGYINRVFILLPFSVLVFHVIYCIHLIIWHCKTWSWLKLKSASQLNNKNSDTHFNCTIINLILLPSTNSECVAILSRPNSLKFTIWTNWKQKKSLTVIIDFLARSFKKCQCCLWYHFKTLIWTA